LQEDISKTRAIAMTAKQADNLRVGRGSIRLSSVGRGREIAMPALGEPAV